jgi:hypothetical protein
MCFLHQILDSKKYIAIVPLSVMATLDMMKSGTNPLNRAARALTTYMEQVSLFNFSDIN